MTTHHPRQFPVILLTGEFRTHPLIQSLLITLFSQALPAPESQQLRPFLPQLRRYR
jgi:hypothetical protein